MYNQPYHEINEFITMKIKRYLNYMLFALFWILVIGLLFYARGAIWYFIIGTLFAFLGKNLVTRMASTISRLGLSRKVSRYLAILVYIAVIYTFILLILLGVGHVILAQINGMLDTIGIKWYSDAVLAKLPQNRNLEIAAQMVLDVVAQVAEVISTQVISVLSSALHTSVELIVALVLMPIWIFYLMSDPGAISAGALRLLPESVRPDAKAIYNFTDSNIRNYLIGETKLGAVVGSMTLILYSIIGMPYVIALAFFAFFLEFIPIYGPWILYFVSVLVAATQGWEMVVAVTVVAAVIQFTEGNLLAPNILGHQTRLRNWQIMLLVPIGSVIAGVWGMLLIIPTVVIFASIFFYLHLRLREKTVSPEQAKEKVESESISFDRF